MRDIALLRKKQVGLRLPVYLVDEIDDLSRMHDLNRSEVITEAIRSYVEEQKAQRLHIEFDQAVKELKLAIQEGGTTTLSELIHELEDI
ncbi:Ribbon-helix-helix protein, copG family [Desulfonatronum zhilinae]|nr:Ribbon-helix-helix protein, copG family [Desulfonatronum zhilinae]